MSKNLLDNNQQQALRDSGTITDTEIAILEGDILLAKNVVTQERRIIGKAEEILTESTTKRILKG